MNQRRNYLLKILKKKENNNSHEFPKSLLSFASDDFWYKEPWREVGVVDGRRRRGRNDTDRRGMIKIKFKPTEKQTQQMRQQQAQEQDWWGAGRNLSWFDFSFPDQCIEMNEGSGSGGGMEVLCRSSMIHQLGLVQQHQQVRGMEGLIKCELQQSQ